MMLFMFLLLTWQSPPQHQPQPLQTYVDPDIQMDTFNAYDIAIGELLRQIAKDHAINIVVDPNIRQTVTLQLHQPTLNELLSVLAHSYQLKVDTLGGVIYVKPLPPEAPPPPKNDIQFDSDTGQIAFDLEGLSLELLCKEITRVTKKNVLRRDRQLNPIISGFQAALPLERGLEVLFATNQLFFEPQEDVFYVASPVTDANGTKTSGLTAQAKQVVKKDDLFEVDIQNQPLAQVIQNLSKAANLEIVLLSDLKGNVTMRARDLTADKLFQYLLAGSEYGYVIQDNIFLIGEKSNSALADSKLLKFQHLNVEMAEQMIPASLTEGITLTRIKELNSLLLTGDRARLNDLEALIGEMDSHVPQVLIELIVVDYSLDNTREAGLNFSNGSNKLFPELDLGLEGFRNSEGSFQIRRLPSNFMLNIKALETVGKARIISKPHIAALNGHEAEITIGTKQFYRLSSEELVGDENPRVRTSETIRDIEANISLKITPWVTGDGEVTTMIEPNFTTFLGNITDNIPPPISTRHLKSTVRLKDGETIILGGLIENRNFTDQNGIPWASRIPLLGALFRNHKRTENRSELVIYLTPHIYYGREGSVEFIREEEGLDYQLDVVRQKKGIRGKYPKKKRWFQRSKKKKKERQPQILKDPQEEKDTDA